MLQLNYISIVELKVISQVTICYITYREDPYLSSLLIINVSNKTLVSSKIARVLNIYPTPLKMLQQLRDFRDNVDEETGKLL